MEIDLNGKKIRCTRLKALGTMYKRKQEEKGMSTSLDTVASLGSSDFLLYSTAVWSQ